ncbi:hypothetical protein JCM39194_16830 [Desulfotomaculum varum]
MLIKTWRLMITLVLVLGILAPAWAASPYLFKDTSGKWWEQAVAECSAAELVGGRGNGIFAPRDSVTQVEAIIFLNRALGQRKEADSYGMSQGGYNFPANFPAWAQRNVAFAADKGYISKAGIPSIQPKKPATRAEIAVLFANALKLSADGYQLNFKDKAAIPAGFQPYVAAAVKHGIMAGRTDNTFDPNANVTRAEMAVIVARLVENGKINPQPDRYFIVRLASVDAPGKKITVSKGGQNYAWSLSNEALLYRAGKRSQLSDFKAGEYVKVVLDTAGKIAYLAFSTGVDTGSVSVTTGYTGTVRGVATGSQRTLSFQPDDGSLTTWPLSASVKISQNGQTRDLTALTVGARAEIKVTNGNITEINLLSSLPAGNESRGYVINMYLDYFTVRYDDGSCEQIEKSKVSGSFYSLMRGQRVAITKVGGLVTGITPINEARKYFGYVVDVGSAGIAIKDLDGYERTLAYGTGYRVKDQDGRIIDRTDLEDGDAVEIELDTQEKAVTIKLLSDAAAGVSDLEGEVTYVKRSGSYRITIKTADGSEKTYDVDQDVQVYKFSGTNRKFDYINEGDYVKLKLNSRDEVVRIDILDMTVLEGEVRSIDTYDFLIKVKNAGGREVAYDLDRNVKVWQDAKSRTIRNVSKGDQVRLLINEEDKVTAINILSGSSTGGTYTGVIYAMDIKEEKLTLEKSNRRTVYNLDDGVTVKNDRGTIDLNDIIIGSEAEIKVENGKVTRIKITNDTDITISGRLDKVSGVRIYIKQNNGTSSGVRHYFITDTNVTIKDPNNRSISLSKLADNYIGEQVTAELDDGEIETLWVK